MALFRALMSQWFPKSPAFTEKDVAPQTGKVFIITGSNTGVGFELAQMLYPTGATIYMAGRSEERIKAAIERIHASSPTIQSPSKLKFLHYDLSDLNVVKAAAASFAAQETKLDILWHNAGIGANEGLTTAQKIEGHIGMNCVAPLLFTQLLLDHIKRAVSSGSPRIIWSGSAITELQAPQGGIDFKLIEQEACTLPLPQYACSKVGNYWLAAECAKRYGGDGIISVCPNPGNLRSEFYRHQPRLFMFFVNPILYHPKYGAYTFLYSGFTSDIGPDRDNGSYIWPWGVPVKKHCRADINDGIENGQSVQFWDWCETKFAAFK